MARFRRGTRSGRRPTSWAAVQSSRAAISAGGAFNGAILDTATLSDVGLEPTLLRIRGFIMCDPDFDPSGTGPSYGEFKWFFTHGAAAGASFSAAELAKENVLDVGCQAWAANRYRNQVTAVGVENVWHMEFQPTHDIDIKAKRVLRAPFDKIYLNMYNVSPSVAGAFTYAFRFLLAVS